jgi:transcriptional regulator with XRE-family HTH domain
MSIGNNIKKIRELKNFTQEYMAMELNMTQAGYSKIERDEVRLSIDRPTEISNVFGVRILDIVDFNEKNIFNNNTQNNYGLVTGINYNYSQDDTLKHLHEENAKQKEIIDILKKELDSKVKKGKE